MAFLPPIFLPAPAVERAQRRREEDRSRGSARQRGYDARWERARKYFLMEHPLCVMCRQEGRVCEATVVDHIRPHKGDRVLFWDRSNWQALCRPHHNSDKQREERGGRPRQRIGKDGWPI